MQVDVKLTIHSDGAARGNPGPAGAGAVLADAHGKLVAEISLPLGEMTNNQAEYRALLAAVEKAQTLGAKALEIFCDSELVVKQLQGEYRVKDPHLRVLFRQLLPKLQSFDGYTIEHIRREQNERADELANLAIDRE